MIKNSMGKFGFTISAGRQIDFDSNNKNLAEYIFENEPSFRLCIECGGCTATCTTGNHTGFSLRELNILIKRGEND
jgi:heterodisulfide reductase subunit C